MVDMQADTIGHVLAAVLTGVAIPFCDFSPELWGHELSLILAVILGKVALESYLGELLVNLFQLIERHGFQIFSHRDGIGIPCIVNLLIPRLLSGQDELKFIIVIDGAIELSLPPFPEPRPIDLGLRCFLALPFPNAVQRIPMLMRRRASPQFRY